MRIICFVVLMFGFCRSVSLAQWEEQAINSQADLRGLSVVSKRVVWFSGTCLVTFGEDDVWFCTGGAATSRVFHSADRGQNWTVSETPILAGRDSAGIFSIAFRERHLGVIVGGDYRQPNDVVAPSAITSDGGKSWKLIQSPLPFRSCVAWAKDRWVAAGTSGSDFVLHDGVTWNALDRKNYNSVAFASTGDGWAVGPSGRIAKFVRE